MDTSTLYSIGHGNKKIEDFVDELKSFGISFLLDIRSKPYSRWNPHFNKEGLQERLENEGITYSFFGKSLGGLPEDKSCYDVDGKVVYDFIKEKDFFKKGLNRLISANTQHIKVAIMCSESKPEECHRSKLIGQELLVNNISIKHIVSKNKFKSQEKVIHELTNGQGLQDLFGEDVGFTSRKSYSI